MSTCSGRRSWWRRSPSRAQPAARSICPRAPTGTTTGPTSACTAARPIKVAAPIDTIPLFVRAGSIVPLGCAGGEHPRSTGHREGARLSRRGRRLHALLRRRHHLRLRERRRLHHAPALGRCGAAVHARWRRSMDADPIVQVVDDCEPRDRGDGRRPSRYRMHLPQRLSNKGTLRPDPPLVSAEGISKLLHSLPSVHPAPSRPDAPLTDLQSRVSRNESE